MLNVLITGAGGQLGQALCRLAAVSPNNYLATDAAELDITDREAVEKTVAEQKIDVIINCAAYTDCLLYTSPSPRYLDFHLV